MTSDEASLLERLALLDEHEQEANQEADHGGDEHAKQKVW
jgi:hypothetical protein